MTVFCGLGAIPTLWGFRLAPKPYCWPHFEWSPTPKTPFSQSHESYTLPAFQWSWLWTFFSYWKILFSSHFGPILFLSFKLSFVSLHDYDSHLLRWCLAVWKRISWQWFNKVEEDGGGKTHSTMSFTSQVPSLSWPLTPIKVILKVYPRGCKVLAPPVASHFYSTPEEGRDKEKLWTPIWGKSLKFPGIVLLTSSVGEKYVTCPHLMPRRSGKGFFK